MKHTKLTYISILMTFTLIISCKQDEKKSLRQEGKDTIEDTKAQATPIALNEQNEAELSYMYQTVAKGMNEKIIIQSNKRFADEKFILISIYKNDVLTKQDTLISSVDYSISAEKKNFKKKDINGKEYIFFYTEGNPLGHFATNSILNFFIIEIAKMDYYNLQFEGESTLRSRDSETLEGNFIGNKKLNQNPVIKKLIFDYANNCELIYKPSEKEKDIFYYKNYAKKWERDNNIDGDMANGFAEIPNKIYSTYYEENIIDYTGEVGESDMVIENSSYKIVSFFRNSIIAYDKIKKLYFPVFVESCITGCNKEIKFVSKDKILITHNEYTGNDYNPEENPDLNVVDINKIVFKN